MKDRLNYVFYGLISVLGISIFVLIIFKKDFFTEVLGISPTAIAFSWIAIAFLVYFGGSVAKYFKRK